MKMAGFVRTLETLLPAAAFAACAGSSGSSGGFSIISCNLGCSSSGLGQISCGIQAVYVNGEIRVSFNEPVDLSTVTAFTFQVSETDTGKTPSATYLLQAGDETTLVYRPKITFDSAGNPVFGLADGASYSLRILGAEEDPSGPWIRSRDGEANGHRMFCTVSATLGVLDTKPGKPFAETTVDKVLFDSITGEVTGKDRVIAAGAENVASDSEIAVTFDEIMNPASLVNPVLKTSGTIKVEVDADGDTQTSTDRVPVAGEFTIGLDQDKNETLVTFTPSEGFPSKGSDPEHPRKIVVTLSESIQDLAGNTLSNPGLIFFTPEFQAFDEAHLVEDFGAAGQEELESGALWGAGTLVPGKGGGSGTLGRLEIESGTFELDTDSADLAALVEAGVLQPATALGATFDGTLFSLPRVEGGIFEFSSLRIGTGATLRFTGSNPARLFVRGDAAVVGRIEVAGEEAPAHTDLLVDGGAGGAPGPGGGGGGRGGVLPDGGPFVSLGGVDHPDDPPLELHDGEPGQGIPWPNALAPTELRGAGGGGIQWPKASAENPTYHLPADLADVSGSIFVTVLCGTLMKGSVGAGGAHGTSGTAGENNPLFGNPVEFEAPVSEPGSSVALGGDDAVETLAPESGYLRGGAGGGGGGAHVAESRTNGNPLLPIEAKCHLTTLGEGASWIEYVQHSGPGGGGGGGGLQLQAGRRLSINGVVDATGGAGASRDADDLGTRATAGGGGAGGALLLQAPDVQLASVSGRLDVSGGDGGIGVGGSRGGAGGAGLLRVEVDAPVPSLASFADKVAPTDGELAEVGFDLSSILSVGEWTSEEVGPGVVSGAQSCWMRADGAYFVLNPLDDDEGELGWDLEVEIVGVGAQSFRGDNDLFETSLEDVFGNELGSSPLVVRFQGVRVVDADANPCGLEVVGIDSAILAGSLTGWVVHPGELDDYFDGPALRPNRVRFVVLFDGAQAGADLIGAVREVSIRVQPD